MVFTDEGAKLRFGKPDFIGIGAQKAGTTWVDHLLRVHPDIWLPPIKELHYFDELDFAQRRAAAFSRMFGSSWEAKRWRRYLAIAAKASTRNPSAFAWYARYLFGMRNNRWYSQLFPNSDSLVRGEITPQYQVLSLDRIQSIHSHLPQLKLILLLRNPIDRTWSQLRMDLLKRYGGRKLEDVPSKELDRFLDRRDVCQRGRGAETISRWIKVFPQEQLQVGLFDDICSCPEQVADKLCHFLGIRPFRELNMEIPGQVHRGVDASMPEFIRARLSEMFTDDILLLQERFGLPVGHWLE